MGAHLRPQAVHGDKVVLVGTRAEARFERQHAAQVRVAAVHVDPLLRRRVPRGLSVTQQERRRGTATIRTVGVATAVAAAAATTIHHREGSEKNTRRTDHRSHSRNTTVLLLGCCHPILT